LQGKTIKNEGSPRKIAAPVCSGKFSRRSRRVDLTPDPRGGTSDLFLQDISNEEGVT